MITFHLFIFTQTREHFFFILSPKSFPIFRRHRPNLTPLPLGPRHLPTVTRVSLFLSTPFFFSHFMYSSLFYRTLWYTIVYHPLFVSVFPLMETRSPVPKTKDDDPKVHDIHEILKRRRVNFTLRK